MYSTKRKSLLQYLPDEATFDSATKSYDVLPQFVSNIKASGLSEEEGTAEHDILELLSIPDSDWEDKFTARVNTYLKAVKDRFSTGDGKGAVSDYMILAEGRRRLYKGWESSKPDGRGLDEFRMTLPIAARPEPFPMTKMTESGQVSSSVSEEEEKYLLRWHWLGLFPERRMHIQMEKEDSYQRRYTQTTGGCPAYASAVRHVSVA